LTLVPNQHPRYPVLNVASLQAGCTGHYYSLTSLSVRLDLAALRVPTFFARVTVCFFTARFTARRTRGFPAATFFVNAC
jgi:hypothetical protein